MRPALPRRGDLPHPPRQEGLPGGDLRAGGRPAQGHGARETRSRARRQPGHLYRRRVPRCARAGLPDGRGACRLVRRRRRRPAAERSRRSRRPRRRPPSAWRCSICRRASSWRPSIPGATAFRRCGTSSLSCGRARSSCPPTSPSTGCCRRRRGARASVTPVDPWAFDADSARRALLAQLRTHSLDGFGLEGHPAAVRGGGRAGPLSEGHPEDGPDAPARRGVQGARRPADCRSPHAEAPRDCRGDGRRARGLAAQRARSHDDAHGGAPPAHVAHPPAALARAHPRPPRRGRGLRLPHD